ncbi:MAG: hypothetical protein AMXMBFR4_04320 [Candidatus Hydrogenedentota bacterium]
MGSSLSRRASVEPYTTYAVPKHTALMITTASRLIPYLADSLVSDYTTHPSAPQTQCTQYGATCAVCGNNRSAALAPLMRHRSLRVFKHLITDSATADALLEIDTK